MSAIKESLVADFISDCHSINEENFRLTLGKIRSKIDLMIQEGVLTKMELQNSSLLARVDYLTNKLVRLNYDEVSPNHQPLPSIWEH